MPANPSTFTPLELLALPDAAKLRDEFVGRDISELRTPAILVDREGFKSNCEFVTRKTAEKGMRFRAHVKTHKTPEGSRIQAQAGDGVRALITSTMPEVWGIIESGLVADGLVDDILYSLPIGADKMEDLTAAQEKCGSKATIRVMVDHAEQIALLAAAHKRLQRRVPWSAFLKVDGGGRRAGAPPRSQQMRELIEAAVGADEVEIYGFYSHFGQSYGSRSLDAAGKFYAGEIECVNDAATLARELGFKGPLVLSVGATPTAHAAVLGAEGVSGQALQGELELHAGCYCLNDLQQLATGVVQAPCSAALNVLVTVVSKYAERGEALCDAGALAMSKDLGPTPGFGKVVTPGLEGWSLGRISQEHGILTRAADAEPVTREIVIGDKLRVVPNHACLACACFPWLYVVEGDTVVDVWVPWKGW